MSHDLYTYGTQDPIYFKVTLNGVGVSVTFQDADVKLFDVTLETWSNIGLEVTSHGNGIHKWIPSAASQTQEEVVIINIKDDAGGPGVFDENCLIIATGGNASARFSG